METLANWKLKQPRDWEVLEARRKEAVRQVVHGRRKQTEVARELGVNRRRVGDWVKAYRKGGSLRALAAKPHEGRDRFLTPAQHDKLRRMLLEGAVHHGFDSDLWTCPRIQALIEQKLKVHHGISTIPRILRRLGFSAQKPEARAVERDEKQIRAFVRRDFERIKKRQEARSHSRLHR